MPYQLTCATTSATGHPVSHGLALLGDGAGPDSSPGLFEVSISNWVSMSGELRFVSIGGSQLPYSETYPVAANPVAAVEPNPDWNAAFAASSGLAQTPYRLDWR